MSCFTHLKIIYKFSLYNKTYKYQLLFYVFQESKLLITPVCLLSEYYLIQTPKFEVCFSVRICKLCIPFIKTPDLTDSEHMQIPLSPVNSDMN